MMNTHFITCINIKHVRHLQHIDIPLAEDTRKHVMITGKNGSGKTSVIEAGESSPADEYEEIAKLEEYLDEVPDYLAVDFMADYTRLKLELDGRG